MASSYQQDSRTNLTDVSGLVAVVTGGGTGLGLIVARALEANGAKVFITGRRKEKLDEAAKLAVGLLIEVRDITADSVQDPWKHHTDPRLNNFSR